MLWNTENCFEVILSLPLEVGRERNIICGIFVIYAIMKNSRSTNSTTSFFYFWHSFYSTIIYMIDKIMWKY